MAVARALAMPVSNDAFPCVLLPASSSTSGTAVVASLTVMLEVSSAVTSVLLHLPTIPVIQLVRGQSGGMDSFEEPSWHVCVPSHHPQT